MTAALDEMRKLGVALYDGDAPNAPELGKFKLANQFLYGSVAREGARYTVVLARMEVSTLTLVPGASLVLSGARGELDRLAIEAAERVVEIFR